jgi:hypothetical protein
VDVPVLGPPAGHDGRTVACWLHPADLPVGAPEAETVA